MPSIIANYLYEISVLVNEFYENNHINNLEDIKIIEVESGIVLRFKKILKKLVGQDVILVHGGGFLGTLWIREEKMFRTILNVFHDNTIIVLPQTAYFSEDEEGKRILEESIKLYQEHKNLYICCREEFSYRFLKEKFPLCNIMLIPDMVLYLSSIEEQKERNDVLFCIRQDKEKIQYDFEKIKEQLNKIGKIDYTDTIIEKRVYTYNNRIKVLNNKINQFAKYKLIVTDRLHGMVFALLAGTPCLVFENKSYKIKGVYGWISNINYIELYDEKDVKSQIEELLKNSNNKYNNTLLLKKYEPLIELINKRIGEKQ